MRLGWTLALVCVLVGVNANAATLHTNTSGDGSSLFLTVWNGSNKSIVVDLGIDATTADFSTLTFDQNFATQLNAAFGSIGSGFQYAVVAASEDILNQGIWTTHTTTTLASYDIVSNSQTIADRLSNYANNNPIANLGLGETNGPTGISSGAGYFNGSNFNLVASLNGTVPPNMVGTVGTALNFYSLLSTNFEANNTRYGGQWLLSSLGELTYAAVPLPAGVYLLGAALLGLVGVARRGRVSSALPA